MIRRSLICALALASVLMAAAAYAYDNPTHLNKYKVPEGCGACHRGRGATGTPLLATTLDKICYTCHGRYSTYGVVGDIESEFDKKYRHPIETTWQYHTHGEILPEEDANTPRHTACFDCHSTHRSEEDSPMKGVPGYDPYFVFDTKTGGPAPGRKFKEAKESYQVCYRCHSDSANLPEGATNKAAEFDTSNESYHPVELAGRNKSVPSLVRKLSVNSTITCMSCHGNDDPRGPDGVHGSDFPFILKARYETDDGIEGPSIYELCYDCHDRRSILGDDSFQRHRVHIVSEKTSCKTCHNSHGSADYEHLIKFNEEVVTASSVGGGPYYTTGASGRPKCTLLCHGADHNSNGIGTKEWPW